MVTASHKHQGLEVYKDTLKCWYVHDIMQASIAKSAAMGMTPRKYHKLDVYENTLMCCYGYSTTQAPGARRLWKHTKVML